MCDLRSSLGYKMRRSFSAPRLGTHRTPRVTNSRIDLAAALFLVACVQVACRSAETSQGKLIRLGTKTCLAQVEYRIMPPVSAPVHAFKGQRVAIAEVVVDEHCTVAFATVTHKPNADESSNRAIEDAVRHWRFSPFTFAGRPMKAACKLIFYAYWTEHGTRVELP